MKPKREITQRLWERVDRYSGECWMWTGPVSDSGYGVISEGGRHGRLLRTHRLAYELTNGAIPEGLQVDHLCMQKLCCRPDHLEVVTQAENLRRWGVSKTTCPRGHQLPERQPGRRRGGCNTCQRIRYSARKKASA